MPKGTLQIAYDKLLLDNLELKERIEQLEATIKNACDLINNEGEVSKWKILNILNQAKG